MADETVQELRHIKDLPGLRTMISSARNLTPEVYRVLRQMIPGNFVFSTFGLASLFAIIKLGARGKSADSINKNIYFSDDFNTEKAFSSIFEGMQSSESIDIQFWNGLYTNSSKNPETNLLEEFMNSVEENLLCAIRRINFLNPSDAASSINSQITNASGFKWKNVVQEDDIKSRNAKEPTRLVLVNCSGFRVELQSVLKSVKGKFFSNNIDFTQINMIKSNHRYLHASLPTFNAQAVGINTSGGNYVMVIILPHNFDGLLHLEELLLLRHTDFQDILTQLKPQNIVLTMPEFRLETTLDVGLICGKLNMGNLFEPGADLSGMIAMNVGDRVFINRGKQHVLVEVTTDGASGSGSRKSKEIIGLNDKVFPGKSSDLEVKVDHPFLFVIVERTLDNILFAGCKVSF